MPVVRNSSILKGFEGRCHLVAFGCHQFEAAMAGQIANRSIENIIQDD